MFAFSVELKKFQSDISWEGIIKVKVLSRNTLNLHYQNYLCCNARHGGDAVLKIRNQVMMRNAISSPVMFGLETIGRLGKQPLGDSQGRQAVPAAKTSYTELCLPRPAIYWAIFRVASGAPCQAATVLQLCCAVFGSHASQIWYHCTKPVFKDQSLKMAIAWLFLKVHVCIQRAVWISRSTVNLPIKE